MKSIPIGIRLSDNGRLKIQVKGTVYNKSYGYGSEFAIAVGSPLYEWAVRILSPVGKYATLDSLYVPNKENPSDTPSNARYVLAEASVEGPVHIRIRNVPSFNRKYGAHLVMPRSDKAMDFQSWILKEQDYAI